MASLFDYRAQQREIDQLAQASAEGQQDFLRQAADMGSDRLECYERYRNAYCGEHLTVLSDRQRQYLERFGFKWCENFCETIVDWLVARLQVEGFSADLNTEQDPESDSEETTESDLAETVNGWWRADRMDEKQLIVHEEVAVCGEGFIIVDWDVDDSRPCFSYNPPEIVKPVYDADRPDLLLYVAKAWNSSMLIGSEMVPIRRLNLYFPDRIEKWFSFSQAGSQGGTPALWHAYVDQDDYQDQAGEDGTVSRVARWPIPWVDANGDPLGIPVVHMRAKPTANGSGRSELRGVIPQNEALNKLIQDLFDVIDYLGSPVPYVTGLEGDMDRQFVVGEWMKIAEKDAKVGMLPGAPPDGILTAISAQLQRIAARSQTPLHALVDTGSIPTGEAFKAAEAPGVKKARLRQIPLGNGWSDCQRIAVKLANVFGGLGLSEDASFEVNWEDPETRNDQAEALTAAAKMDIGVSKYTLLSEMGYDPDEEAERRAKEAEEALTTQQNAMDRGAMGAGAYTGQQDVPSQPNQAPTMPTVQR